MQTENESQICKEENLKEEKKMGNLEINKLERISSFNFITLVCLNIEFI